MALTSGLQVDQVTVRFGSHIAVDDVSLTLGAGQVLAVLGPSGCGKSTLLRAVAGLERPSAGRIFFDGEDLAGIAVHKRGFALMFQDGQLFDHLSVAGNVEYALRVRGQRSPKRVAELLELVGLAGYSDRSPTTLSGGERQRVALARALAASPRLLLLDEPLSALDPTLRERLAHDLREILVATGTTAVMVTHDHEEAFAVADAMALMRSGRLVQSGGLNEVWAAPVDEEAALFLGYSSVVDGSVLGEAPGPMALRRSALVVSADGALSGVVTSVRGTPELTRLEVEVRGVGVVSAVAAASVGVLAGQEVRLTLDRTRTARVGAVS